MTGRITAMGLKEVLVGAARAGDWDGVGWRGPTRAGPGGWCVGSSRGRGVRPGVLRTWVRRAGIDAGDRPGTTTDEARRIKEPASGVRGPGAGQ
mgnify:CR=1 FL=1